MTDQAVLEPALQAKGLDTSRFTPAMDASITAENYHVFPGTTLTVCALTLRNGFIVTGESVAGSLENFNEHLGRRIARENARQKIWAMESYLLHQRLSADPT